MILANADGTNHAYLDPPSDGFTAHAKATRSFFQCE
jgi:hypothetical protein